MRLVDSSGNPVSSRTGLLQMAVNRIWKYVCNDYFVSNNNGVKVACGEMGFSSMGSQSHGTAHTDLFYDDVQCTGTESSLVDCPRNEGDENCGNDEAVTLTCVGMFYEFWKEIIFSKLFITFVLTI